MKKLLTILVSAASACFAFADGFTESGTSFESYQLGETGFAELKLSDQDADGKRYWLSGAQSDFGIVTNYQSDTAIPSDITRPTKFASETNNKYLRLDTSDTLFRTINSYVTSDATEGTEAVTTTMNTVDIGQGIYFDSLVQFTATEDYVTPTFGEDKLVVWLKAVEGTDAVGNEGEEGYVAPVAGSTNLVITAGNGFYQDGDKVGQAIPKHFFTSKAIESGSWHRLTIKAFVVNNERTYFNVFIDGNQVTYGSGDNEVTDFESLISYINDDSKTISAVGFKGNGAVDDLVFTTTDPLYVAPSTYAITGPVYGEGTPFASISYSLDEAGEIPVADLSAIGVGTKDVWAYIMLNDGYKFDGATYNGGAVTGNDVDGGILIKLTLDTPVAETTYSFVVNASAVALEVKPFTVNGVAYKSLVGAIKEATAGDTIVVAQGADGATSYNIEGIKIEKSIIIDLNGNTLVLNKPAVGATEATQTLGIRIEGPEKSLIDVTIMNGEIEISEANLTKKDETDKQIKMMINNYANLTLDSVILDGTNLVDPANNQPKYVLSNNRGNVLLKGTTSIIVPTTGTSVAFDVCKFQDYDVPTVTLKLDEGYTIGGDVEVTGGNFVYEAGEISGAIKFSSGTIKGVAKEDITIVPGDKVLGTNTEGAWILVDKPADPQPELPTPGVAEGEEINQTYEDEAKAAIKDAFTTGGTFTPPPALVVEVNGEVLLGNAAVEMINEVTKVFDITEGKFFDANGKMEVTFKATSADPAKITYEAKVGEANATVDAAYEVVPKYIDLATGKETTPAQDATAKFFKLVIREKSVQ